MNGGGFESGARLSIVVRHQLDVRNVHFLEPPIQIEENLPRAHILDRRDPVSEARTSSNGDHGRGDRTHGPRISADAFRVKTGDGPF